MDRIVGAFLFPETWIKWNERQARAFLESLKKMGVNTIFTETTIYRDDLIEWSHQQGIKWFGGISCFSDHANDNRALKDHPELWPVSENGLLREKMEWYLGVTPTFEEYKFSQIKLAEKIVRSHDLDGFMLDFIRWPIHWELELRLGASKPLQYSFDSHTLELFQREYDIVLPDRLTSTKDKAKWILDECYQPWVAFKCKTISDFVGQITKQLRNVRSMPISLGLYCLPMPLADLEAVAGQNIFHLANHLDYIAPMTYHAILHRPIQWVREIINDLSGVSKSKILPVLQVDSSEGMELGADWGPTIPVEEWEELLKLIINDSNGLILFTGTSLFRDGRGEILKAKNLATRQFY
jgi:hypothetical protein